MPVCATALLQPDGSYLLALNPAETNLSACAYAVETGSESLLGTLAAMTPDNALVISGAVALFWGTCWGFRMLRLALIDPEISSERETS